MNAKMFKKLATISFLFILGGCSGNNLEPPVNPGICTVTFDANTSLKTSNVSTQTVAKGSKVKKPACKIIGENSDNLEVFGWYKEKECENQWDFKKDSVEQSQTLYAKWERLFTVNYYVGDSEYPSNTIKVFNGNKVKEYKEYCVGFNYLGSFKDKDFTIPFSYDEPITANTDIYMKKSDYIDIYEGNPTGGLFNNLEINGPTDNSGEVGYISKTAEKDAVIINFGYTPKLADPFVEISLNLDIRKSPVLHFVLKNIGPSQHLSFYFTTLNDLDNYEYSVTGKDYGPNFKAEYQFKQNEVNMSMEDEYADIAIDFAKESMFHGYSVWGTSECLGKLRIQSTYQSKNYEDRSNQIILKRIYGDNTGYEGGVIVDDSEDIKDLLQDNPTGDATTLSYGFSFPNDLKYLNKDETVSTYNRDKTLLVHYENEINMRSKTNKSQKFSFQLPTNDIGDVVGDKLINLEELKTVQIRLRNLGYAEELKVAIKNDYNGTTYGTIKLSPEMDAIKTFSLSFANEKTMAHMLKSLEFEYVASGVNNAIIFESITFTEQKAADIAGISFDDKYCFGLSGENVEVSYTPNNYSTSFNVANSGAFVTSNKTNINITTRGYYSLELTYSRPSSSNISKVFISFNNGFSYGNEFEFVTDAYQTTKTTVDFPNVLNNDVVKNIKIRFEGTGIIRIQNLKFLLNDDYCLDLGKDFTSSFDSTWISGINYSFDDELKASCFTRSQSVTIGNDSIRFYLSVGKANFGNIYNCTNLKAEGKSKFVIVYHNGDSKNVTMNVSLSYSGSINGIPDQEQVQKTTTKSLTFVGNMGDYEWKSVEFDLDNSYSKYFIGKINFSSLSGSITIRSMSII